MNEFKKQIRTEQSEHQMLIDETDSFLTEMKKAGGSPGVIAHYEQLLEKLKNANCN